MTELNRATCEEAFRHIDDYLDRNLAPADMQRIDEHLKVCAACLSEFTFEASLIDQVRTKLSRIKAPPGLLERITEGLSRPDPSEGP